MSSLPPLPAGVTLELEGRKSPVLISHRRQRSDVVVPSGWVETVTRSHHHSEFSKSARAQVDLTVADTGFLHAAGVFMVTVLFNREEWTADESWQHVERLAGILSLKIAQCPSLLLLVVGVEPHTGDHKKKTGEAPSDAPVEEEVVEEVAEGVAGEEATEPKRKRVTVTGYSHFHISYAVAFNDLGQADLDVYGKPAEFQREHTDLTVQVTMAGKRAKGLVPLDKTNMLVYPLKHCGRTNKYAPVISRPFLLWPFCDEATQLCSDILAFPNCAALGLQPGHTAHRRGIYEGAPSLVNYLNVVRLHCMHNRHLVKHGEGEFSYYVKVPGLMASWDPQPHSWSTLQGEIFASYEGELNRSDCSHLQARFGKQVWEHLKQTTDAGMILASWIPTVVEYKDVFLVFAKPKWRAFSKTGTWRPAGHVFMHSSSNFSEAPRDKVLAWLAYNRVDLRKFTPYFIPDVDGESTHPYFIGRPGCGKSTFLKMLGKVYGRFACNTAGMGKFSIRNMADKVITLFDEADKDKNLDLGLVLSVLTGMKDKFVQEKHHNDMLLTVSGHVFMAGNKDLPFMGVAFESWSRRRELVRLHRRPSTQDEVDFSDQGFGFLAACYDAQHPLDNQDEDEEDDDSTPE